MTLPQDAWLLGLGLSLCAAFFALLALARRPRAPIRRYETIRWPGLAGAAILALYALGRSDAVMLCALVFFAALLLIRPRGGSEGGGGEREKRGGRPGGKPPFVNKRGFFPRPPLSPKKLY